MAVDDDIPKIDEVRYMSKLKLPTPTFQCNSVFEGVTLVEHHLDRAPYSEKPGNPQDGCRQCSEPEGVAFNALGLPYRSIAGGAYPPFFSPHGIQRLQEEWAARPDDVFLVFPADPVSSDFQAFSVALVEQCEVGSVDLEFPRWIEGAVSCCGWEYVNAIDTLPTRRCLTTKAPPWRFPSTSLSTRGGVFHKGCRKKAFGEESEHDVPLIAVFVADPRIMVMKELSTAMKYAEVAQSDGRGKHINGIGFMEVLTAMVTTGMCDSGGVGLLGNSLRTTLGWAKAEAMYPQRIRLFFTEDFVLEPEVAMRGLANFLQVPDFSVATDRVVQQAARLANIAVAQSSQQPLGAREVMKTASVESLVMEFEKQLGLASAQVQAGWAHLVEGWLMSPNSCMVEYAQTVLQHNRWSPPLWRAAHNARICRPCLYFPRGKCSSDECRFCHGPNHPKPKRTPKAKRMSRRRFDRTPSPGVAEMPSPASLDVAKISVSAHARYDRTPSPERQWVARM